MSDDDDPSPYLRLPPFCAESPEVWFLQCESQFQLQKVTANAARFRHVVGVLPPEVSLERA